MQKEQTKYISSEKIIEIVNEFKNENVSRRYLGRKYNVSGEMVGRWIKLDKEGTLYEYLLKREESQRELGFYEIIEKYENMYNPFNQKPKIINFYRHELRIGDNVILDFETIDSEIAKLQSFLFSDDFKREYGREYNIVDLYLTTNLSVKDIVYNYQAYMDFVTQKRFISFIRSQLVKVDNIKIFSNWLCNYKASLYSRFQRPAQKRILQMLNQDFILFNNIKVCKQDIYKAYQILLDLNEKYGVKYDEISFYYVLDAYINNYVDSYYTLGEKYKAELDKVTHVQKNELPTLTRRENNN